MLRWGEITDQKMGLQVMCYVEDGSVKVLQREEGLPSLDAHTQVTKT